ncbi:MAG: hypothetical protein ACU85V_10960 [Gammaproteobacteria bacterium]
MTDDTTVAEAAAATPQVGIRLRTNEDNEIPHFANIASVQGDQRQVIVDFGFIEPAAGAAAARRAKEAGTSVQELEGRVSCRVVVGIDVAAQLSQQLARHIRTMASAAKTGDEQSEGAA